MTETASLLQSLAGRLGDRLRPVLWQIHGERQIYLTTLMSTGLSQGPALVACAHVPDLHHRHAHR